MIFQIYHIIYMIWVVLILVNSSPKSFIVVAKSGFWAASSINRSPNSSLMNPSSTSRWTIRWTPSNVDSRFFTGMDCLGVGMVSSLLWFAMKFWEFCKWLCLDSLLKWVGFPDPGKRDSDVGDIFLEYLLPTSVTNIDVAGKFTHSPMWTEIIYFRDFSFKHSWYINVRHRVKEESHMLLNVVVNNVCLSFHFLVFSTPPPGLGQHASRMWKQLWIELDERFHFEWTPKIFQDRF